MLAAVNRVIAEKPVQSQATILPAFWEEPDDDHNSWLHFNTGQPDRIA